MRTPILPRPSGPSETFVITPHPDDETIACGGVILDRLQDGNRVHVVLMTDGSQSHRLGFHIEDDPTPGRLAEIRAEEFRRVVSSLGVSREDMVPLGFEDASLGRDEAAATFALQAVLEGRRENIAEIFYPSAYDSHRDHRATHKIVNRVLARMDIRPRRFCYTVWPELEDRPPEPDLRIDISAHMAAKSRAMSMYLSQIERISARQPAPVLSLEFLARFFAVPEERFWTSPEATGEGAMG